jgi:hypothetical protein
MRDRSTSPGRVKNCHFSMPFRSDLGPTFPPIQRVARTPFRWLSGRGVKLATHLELVPRSRKRGPMHSPFHTPLKLSA